MTGWLTTADLAEAAGISRQKAHGALSKASLGKSWRGAELRVRQDQGGGGRGGSHYLVWVGSLPLDLREKLQRERAERRGPLSATERAAVEREWRFQIIEPLLVFEHYGRGREAALAEVAAKRHPHPVLGTKTVSVSALRRWLKDHEACGLGGLQNRKRKDAGCAQTDVSRTWDNSVPFNRETRRKIAAQMRQDLRDLWGNGAVYSVVRRLASEALAVLTRANGFDTGPEELARLCLLPKNVVESERDARRVHQFKTDRKAWNDHRSRVRRSPDSLRPMRLVMADVHHVDVLITRTDGSKATPKLIAWMDVATHRVRVDLVLCEPGTAVRNEDLCESFVSMVADPEWGVPSGLYLDNGSEFRFADFLSDVLRLAGIRVFDSSAGDPVKRATPHEGASKGLLEGSFRIFQQQLFAVVQGFIGGDRMKSKSASLSRPQLPFAGGFDAFVKAVRTGIDYHNTNERRGQLRNKTPDQVFRAFVDRGWMRIDADPEELMMAFSTDATRVVRQGKITVSLPGDPKGSTTYVHSMLSRFEGQTIKVRLPKFRRWPGLPVYAPNGERIGIASPEMVYGYDDPAGAIEAKRRKREDLTAIRELGKTVQQIDIGARMAASAEARKGTSIPESGGTITLGGDQKADAAEMHGQGWQTDEQRALERRARQAREAAERAKRLPYPQLYKR